MRLASMVDLVDSKILDLDYEFNGVVLEKELMGYGLARNYRAVRNYQILYNSFSAFNKTSHT